MSDSPLLIIGIQRKIAFHTLVGENFFEKMFVIFHKSCTFVVQSRAFLSQCSDTGDESGFFISSSEGTTSYLHHQLFHWFSDKVGTIYEIHNLADGQFYMSTFSGNESTHSGNKSAFLGYEVHLFSTRLKKIYWFLITDYLHASRLHTATLMVISDLYISTWGQCIQLFSYSIVLFRH